jgi:uncharacterized heparinase superfamily protein
MAISTARNFLRRAAEKPLHILLWKGWQLGLKHARRVGYWQKLSSDLQRQVDRIPPARLREVLLKAPQLICPTEVGAAAQWLGEHRAREAKEVIREADNFVAFRWSLLGSESQFQNFPVPWCSDWRVGYTWPRTYYADVDYAALGALTDVKYPWELSRFYFAPTLGQAYRITGDKRYKKHFLSLHRDWAAQNPVGWSINWCSPLEVALRGVHLSTAVSFFSDLEDNDLRFLVHQLAVHGAFLRRNVEYTDIRGNHYTGNLYGLLVLGCLLEAVVSEARRWRAYAEKHIESEIMLQFYPDGVNIEKSIHYHRFVLDMFLYCAILLERNGSGLSPAARDRLLRALQFTAAYLSLDGTAPCVGDSDDGWALRIALRQPRDHRGTLALGAALFCCSQFCEAHERFSPECLWVLRRSHLNEESFSSTGEMSRAKEAQLGFPQGGFLVSKGNGCYLLFDVGEVGLRGRGGHGHNDTLSFELWLGGVPILVDPGMPTYTGDIKLRNRFRGTAAHNTALVDQTEQASLWGERSWRLGNEAHVSEVEEHRKLHEDCFAARHHGFERLQSPVRYHRRLVLNRAVPCFQGVDTFEGDGTHLIQIFFHVGSGITLIEERDHVGLQSAGHSWLFSAEGGRLYVGEGEVSPSYGVRLPVPVIEIRAEVELPAQISYAVRPFADMLSSQ